MYTDIYCKLPTDLGYRPRMETLSEEEIILQQIRILLGTTPGDVLGDPGFGLDIKQYLFSFNNNADDIKKMVSAAIDYYIRYDREKFNIGVDVNYGKNRDCPDEYAVIDIFINEKKWLGFLVNQ